MDAGRSIGFFYMSSTPAIALPSNWASFVDQVTLGGDPIKAAEFLGFDNPRAAAAALLRHPTVRKALATAAEARLEGVCVPLALDTIEEILKDATAPKAVRAKLALGVMDRVRAKEDKTLAAGGKSLADMTARELEQLMAQLAESGVRPGEMRDVTPKPDASDVVDA